MLSMKFKKIVKPNLENQTLYQMQQMKTFVDRALQTAGSQNFNSDTEKIKYLLESLNTIRDFILTQTTENSLRLSLIQQFQEAEEEIKMGNDSQLQEEKALQKVEEKLVQNQSQSELKEIKKEEIVESTTDS